MYYNQTKILGVNLFSDKKFEAIEVVKSFLKKGNIKYNVVTPNVDFLVNAIKDKKFAELLNKASLSLPDGKPLVWVTLFNNKRIKEKISGSSFFYELLEKDIFDDKKIFLLGGTTPQILEKALVNINNFKIKKVSGYSPPFGFENNENELSFIINKINEFKTDVLVIGLGSPKQEYLLEMISTKINYNVCFCLGATIDFISGEKKMPSDFVKYIGLAWCWRLFEDPKRMWKRYLIKDMKFFYYILLENFKIRKF